MQNLLLSIINMIKRTRADIDFGLDDLENTDYNNENTVFEALWNESGNADNIDEVEYKFYFSILIQMANVVKKKKQIDVSSPFDLTGVEIKVRKILYRTIKYYWSVQ